MRIVVTKEHWDRGVNIAYPILKRRIENRVQDFTGDAYCETCVLAQAFRDAGFKAVMVNQNMAHLDGGRYCLPTQAQRLLRKFDVYETQVRTGRTQEGFKEPSFPVEFEIDAVKK